MLAGQFADTPNSRSVKSRTV